MTNIARTPTLEDVIDLAIDQRLCNLHTAMPGMVEAYDPIEQTVDVKPLIKNVQTDEDENEIEDELPVLSKVPLMFPRGGKFFISWPIAVGDIVLLVFCERSIDTYTATDGTKPVDPVDMRRHDLSDAVAFPGFYPFKNAIKDIDDANLVLGMDDGKAKIIIEEAAVEVKLDNGATMRLEGKDSAAKATFGDGAKSIAIADHLQTLWGQLKTQMDIFDAHIHPTGVGPSGPPNPLAAIPAYNTSINSTKVKIPDG